MRLRVFLVVGLALVAALWNGAGAQDQTDIAKTIVPFVEKHCVHCHGPQKKKADLVLHVFKDEASILKARKTWMAVLNQIHAGEMPPSGRPKPAAQESEQFAKAVLGVFDRYDRTAKRDPGKVTMRRLNKAEYVNTIRDLVGVDIPLGEDFPSDDVGHGFDNIGDVLTISPLHMERYMASAEMIMKSAIIVGEAPKPVVRTTAGRFLEPAIVPVDRPRPLYSKGPLHTPFKLSQGGQCKVVVRMQGLQAGDEPAKAAIIVDGKEVKQFVCPEKGGNAAKPYSVELNLTKGEHRVGVSLLNEYKDPDDEKKKRGLMVEYIQLIGPMDTRPDSQLKLLAAPENLDKDAKTRLILERFATQAYRRPATKDEIDRLIKIVNFAEQTTWFKLSPSSFTKLKTAKVPDDVLKNLAPMEKKDYLQEPQFIAAIKDLMKDNEFKEHQKTIVSNADQYKEPWEGAVSLAMQAVLCSPKFLFRVELDSRPTDKNAHPIDDYQLASRLSYFLWSTMPDQELLDLAAKKQLHQNIPAQVKRMLADDKSKALVENFLSQWLQLRPLKAFTPDAKLFPEFSDRLRADMITETEMFFGAIMKEDRSILDLIDGKFTFLNERLGKLYGIRDTNGNPYFDKAVNPQGKVLQGDTFVRVSLDNTKRGGLLTQASVLTVTSNPTRTSPVKRGRWVLEQILGTPPPPPPPDVPELDSKKETKGTLRQRMEQHRENPSCAGCHARMDPIGFAFENFSAIGKFRSKDGELPIDPAGELPGGQKFTGPEELKAILKGKKELFSRCLAEKMLTYATGRGLEYYDKPAVDGILAALSKNEYRFSSLITAIAQSDPFRLRRGKDQE